jgi:predicted RNase H-like nuclease (RuvC/YqgF family)
LYFILLEKAQQKEEDYREEIKLLKIDISAETHKFEQLLLSFEEREGRLKQTMMDMEVKHTQEVEELRKYFEQKCLQMEKQYSEEVLSSRKMSDNESEIEDLTEDLYVGGSTVNCLGGGGDALGMKM